MRPPSGPSAPELDVDAHVKAIRPGATCKGVLFAGIVERARRVRPDFDPTREAGIPARRYLPFLNYPYEELLRLIPHAARAMRPTAPPAEAVRRLGQGVFADFRSTHAGRVLLGALVDDLGDVLMSAPRVYSMTISVGHFESERVGPRHVRVRFEDYPGYLETYDVGVLEGAAIFFDVSGRVHATRSGPNSGTLDAEW